jgi:hypothetical protein
VQNLLAEAILSGTVGRGDTAVVDFANGKFTSTRRSREPELAGSGG